MVRTNQRARGLPPPCICGFYFINPSTALKECLPLVSTKTHTTILSTASRTVMTQTFENPTSSTISELRYMFPLYAGISVVAFSCHINDRQIEGVVQERAEARATYEAAQARGETAGLLEQLPASSDVFSTSVANVPADATLTARLEYVGELVTENDGSADTLRFTLPTSIAPRYGDHHLTVAQRPARLHLPWPGADSSVPGTSIEATVDVRLAEGSAIREVRSPTHPVAVSMGVTSVAPQADPDWSVGSARLALGAAALDQDFVLLVHAKDSGAPKAVLETHPTRAGQRALMATFVPRFSLKGNVMPEIVFVCDRSGSMSGNIKMVQDALYVFLKSLPQGCKFNICSFGSGHSFLYGKSQAYGQQSLQEAMAHVDQFAANYGGTETYGAVEATLNNRYGDIPLEMILLTDGEIWNQSSLFELLNREVQQSKAPIRTFTLGIGRAISHALIQGVAKAGNGFSQSVMEGEKMERVVVRMLKGALSPHLTDCSLEIRYEDEEKRAEAAEATEATSDDDWDIVEKVADSLKVKMDLNDSEKAGSEKSKKRKSTEPISLYDDTMEVDEEPFDTGDTNATPIRIDPPKLLQAPSTIPPLFPFTRTIAYILMSPEATQKTPKSVVFRATAPQGPLQLEIPVLDLQEPGQTIHQLAARKAMLELEEGRGWLAVAKDEAGHSIKESYASQYDDLVKGEAVRLGTSFQIAGKHTSFVAVEKKHEDDSKTAAPASREPAAPTEHPDAAHTLQPPALGNGIPHMYSAWHASPRGATFGSATPAIAYGTQYNHQMRHMSSLQPRSYQERRASTDRLVDLAVDFNSAPPPPPAAAATRGGPIPATAQSSQISATYMPSGSSFGAGAPVAAFGAPMQQMQQMQQAASAPSSAGPVRRQLASRAAAPPPAAARAEPKQRKRRRSRATLGCGLHDDAAGAARSFADAPAMQRLIRLQTFEGCWEWAAPLFEAVGVSEAGAAALRGCAADEADAARLVATMVAVAWLERFAADDEASWELLVEKARAWVDDRIALGKADEAWAGIGKLVEGASVQG